MRWSFSYSVAGEDEGHALPAGRGVLFLRQRGGDLLAGRVGGSRARRETRFRRVHHGSLSRRARAGMMQSTHGTCTSHAFGRREDAENKPTRLSFSERLIGISRR